MSNKILTLMIKIHVLLFGIIIFAIGAQGQNDVIDFDSENWDLTNAQVTNYLGRKALTGIALLKNVEFENGIIEVDIAVDGKRSYPGIIFRMQSEEDYERFYIRPHRAGLYPDALQYAPSFNGVSGWQLYHGEGCTAGAIIPVDQWNHLRLEIHGTQGRVYWNDNAKPALEIHDLKHGVSKGKIGLMRGPGNADVYFSNFRCRLDGNLEFKDPSKTETPQGMIMEWEISKIIQAQKIDIELLQYPRFYSIYYANWQKVSAESSGLVNIDRYAKREEQKSYLIFARTIFKSDKKQEVKLSFGYSDEVTIYLNGKRMFYGISAYQWRDRSFLGVVGLNDVVYLNVEKGLNEIFFIVKDYFGGWGFMAKAEQALTPPVKDHSRLTKAWETPQVFLTPESVVYDPEREILYVTNFDNRTDFNERDESKFTGYISRVKLNGEIEQLKWIDHLHGPSGMAIYKEKLYLLERRNLTEIDINFGRILDRYQIPDCDFPNDLAIDSKGSIYISDTRPSDFAGSRIYKFTDGKFEVWEDSYEVYRANGMFIHDNKLLFGGNPGDPFFKSIDLETKKIENIASLGAGVIDGIKLLNNGNYLVSHWEGHMYIVTPTSEVTEISDTVGLFNSADFEYIKEKNLLIIPTFCENKVMAYRLTENKK